VVFEEVQTDLENQGYEVQAYILPACGKNAPHKRERTWFVAYSKLHKNKYSNNGGSKQEEGNLRREDKGNVFDSYNSNGITSNSFSIRRNKIDRITNRESNVINQAGEAGIATYSNTSRILKQHITSKSNKKDKFGRTSFERRDFTSFPTEPPICGGDDGISREMDGITFSKWRNESIKAYGNAIVPQVAYEIFKAIQSFDDLVNV
jgi:DNA (cytosine-5)-methyltransferase 1